MLLSSHIMQEVARLCDRIVVIAHGRVVADGTPDELRASDRCANLEDAFVKAIGIGRGPVRMRALWVVLRKELLDAFRDRRMVLVAFLLMPLAVPLMLAGTTRARRAQAGGATRSRRSNCRSSARSTRRTSSPGSSSRTSTSSRRRRTPTTAVRAQRHDVVLRIDDGYARGLARRPAGATSR